MAVEYINITDIHRDDRLMCRSRLDHEHVARIMERFQDAGDWPETIPPLVVFRLTSQSPARQIANFIKHLHYEKMDGQVHAVGTLVLVSGYHRFEAANRCEMQQVPCVIVEGTWDDAERTAWKQNSDHGLPRTNNDLRIVLGAAHSNNRLKTLSIRKLADMLACTKSSVERYRKELEDRAKQVETEIPFPVPNRTDESQNQESPRASFRDAYGNPIPEWLEERFRCVEKAKRVSRRIRAAAEELLRLKYKDNEAIREPGLETVDARSIYAEMVMIADRLDSNIPWLVCPQCEGRGEVGSKRCDTCQREGYLVRHQADTLPPELERKAAGGAA